MRILHGECYCPTVDTVYAAWRSENFRITCDDDKYHKWQSHFHSSLLIEKSSKFITSTTKVDGKQLYYTVYVHTIPYTTEVYGLSISAILYGRWTYQLRSYKFLSLIMPNNKINRKKIPSADALLISNEQWWNGSWVFFSQRCQNIIIFHIIEQKKNTVFMQWLTSSLSLQKPIHCCP